ncbi:hypothetical protein P7C70_g751, partial [Phenoliferia sp. Uapishka_3]
MSDIPNNAVTDHNIHDDYIKNPPNNLGLKDPSEQSITNSLIGVEGTETARDPPSAEEEKRVKELAEKLNK